MGMKMSDYEFILPLMVILPRKRSPDRKFSVNMNTFTGIKPHTYDEAKKMYREVMREQLEGFDMIFGKIHISYDYYARMDNSPDLDNFVSAAKKFFQDAMVGHGFIQDDNVHFIVSSSERYCGIDRKNPRIVAKIDLL